jgi:hypothetical protein
MFIGCLKCIPAGYAASYPKINRMSLQGKINLEFTYLKKSRPQKLQPATN